jgi:HK97 family phage portal protein
VILRTPTGQREERLFELSAFIPRPGSTDAILQGPLRTPAIMVAAVACAVRLVAESLACCQITTGVGSGMSWVPKPNSWQASLFADPAPVEGWTPYDLVSDTASAVELAGHSFLWKAKGPNGRVSEIYPIDPDYVRVTRKDGLGRSGPKMIQARVEGQLRDITEDVVHIRGWSPLPAVDGTSTTGLHRKPLLIAQQFDEFRGRYFANDGLPGIILNVQGQPTKNQRRDILESWVKRHGGVRQANRPGIVWGGTTVEKLDTDLQKAQAADVADSITRDVARMFKIIPLEMLHATVRVFEPPESLRDKFSLLTLKPRSRRIEAALYADRDLFPDRRASGVRPRLDMSEFLYGDVLTTSTIVHDLVQVGVLTQNEGRALMGLPPSSDPRADVLQQTPVGGAPNAEGDPSGGSSDSDLESKALVEQLLRRIQAGAVPALNGSH